MKDCSSKLICGVDGCKARHHQLLHGAPRMFNGEAKATTTVAIGTATVKGPRPPTLLCIVPVTLKSGSGKSLDTYALIDNGAEATLITKKAAKQLGLSGPVDHMRLSSIHGQDPVVKTEEVDFSILPRNQSKSFKVTNALAIKKLMLSERKINWPVAKREWEHIADIDLPAINSDLVTILLGRDTRGVHDTYETRRSEDGTAPEAVLTPFGWCIAGPIPNRVLDTHRTDISIHHVHPAVSSFEPVAGASPTNCTHAFHRTAEDMRSADPHVADLVKRTVDNLLHSTETKDEAIRDARDFKTLCRHGGFNVVQGMSTARKLLATIDPSELAQPIKNLEHDPLPTEHVFGMLRDSQTDEFISKVSVNDVNPMRDVLQSISSIYDPIRLISVVILQARVILRERWRVKCTWDQPLLYAIRESWNQWSSNLVSPSQLRIPRCLRRPQKPILQEIHSFSDASEQGFVVCIHPYSVYEPDDIKIRFIIDKSRVAPLRQLSILRLKLQGALMASRLTDTIRTELNWKGAIPFWCDSQTTLQWIHSSSCRFHTFVPHRVTEITDQFHPRQCRHVPGPLNPVDDASRGISQTDLSSDQTASKGIDWKFSPPAAPHFGGVWERIVRSAKIALRTVLRNRTVKDEVLLSALGRVEALLNDRPFIHVSVDPRDLEALTPNHFLLERANPTRPPDVIRSTDTLSPESWRLAQLIVTQFWHRCLREYIPDLIERRIWLKPRRNLNPGDIVLVVDPATRRGDWPIGHVPQVHPGSDGVVISASVKTAHGITNRPSVKLCLLEADSSEDVSTGNRAGYVADDAPFDPGPSTSTPAP
jgi:hypothetical protein